MNRTVKTRGGRGKAAVLAAGALLAGVLVGRWVLGKDGHGGRSWRVVEELHQMYPAPDGFNVVETNLLRPA
jgi:hypothetical protein